MGERQQLGFEPVEVSRARPQNKVLALSRWTTPSCSMVHQSRDAPSARCDNKQLTANRNTYNRSSGKLCTNDLCAANTPRAWYVINTVFQVVVEANLCCVGPASMVRLHDGSWLQHNRGHLTVSGGGLDIGQSTPTFDEIILNADDRQFESFGGK